MKNGMTRLWRRLVAAVLGLLGFASCSKEVYEERDNYLVMYGQPQADFKTVGNVSDESGKPIKGISVTVKYHWHIPNQPWVIYDQNDFYQDSNVKTDDKGTYQLSESIMDLPTDVTLVFEDIDGPENGGDFAPAEATPSITQTRDASGAWFLGAYEAKADVVMKKK